MTAYDILYADAIDNYGLVSTKRARELGVSQHTLAVLANRGRLRHLWHGLYGLSCPIPFAGNAAAYAQVVESVGPDAVLQGVSVLALLELFPENPATIHVAVQTRLRRRIPAGVVVHRLTGKTPTETHLGIRSQDVVSAIRDCVGEVMPERLLDAMGKARAKGLLSAHEYNELRKDLLK